MELAESGQTILVQINSHGFRAARDYDVRKPPGHDRVIAVGDSFTFGHVDIEDTWPSQLERKRRRLEVINMGALGYGLDQMYLWYKEDGIKFEADLVVCALVQRDLMRVLLHKQASGYGKPVFRLNGPTLELTNVPVPERIPPGSRNVHRMDFATFLAQRGLSNLKASAHRRRIADMAIPHAILVRFRQLVQDRGAAFLVLLLPQRINFESEDDQIRNGLTRACDEAGITLLDLTEPLRERLQGNYAKIFGPDRHYNAEGNRLVAELMFAHLQASGLK